MKRFGIVLLAAVFLFSTVAPAAANGGFHGHVVFWPLLAPLWLPVAVVATVTTGVAAVATGVAAAVTAPLTYPYAAVSPPPVYAPPAAYAPQPVYAPRAYAPAPPYAPPPTTYAPPATAYAPPATAYTPPPPTYARVAYSAPPPPSQWYYCPSAGTYFPYVRACPGGWRMVVPR